MTMPAALTRALPLALLVSVMLPGCATIPEGELQLGPKIARDMKDRRGGAPSPAEGRPLYAEVFAYPQMLLTGDILAGGTLLLCIGREDLSLEEIVIGYGHDRDGTTTFLSPIVPEVTTKKAPRKKTRGAEE
jgi:hypothetical protein